MSFRFLNTIYPGIGYVYLCMAVKSVEAFWNVWYVSVMAVCLSLDDIVLDVPLRVGCHVKTLHCLPFIKNKRPLFLLFHMEQKQ